MLHTYANIRDKKGFSILVALGTIGVLLIIMTSLASIYVNEMRLSRLQYNTVLAHASMEGAFEYAMLKRKNHRDGFQDRMTSTDPDAQLLVGLTDRSKGVESSYIMQTQSVNERFFVAPDSELIIPLMVGNDVYINGSSTSKNPKLNRTTVQKVTSLTELRSDISDANLNWSIVASERTPSGSIAPIGIAGSGAIVPGKKWVVRRAAEDCFDAYGGATSCGGGLVADSLGYYYDEEMSVDAFLSKSNLSDPYLVIYNAEAALWSNVTLKTSSPFTLPKAVITVESKKGTALQSLRYTDDKGKYYDAVKFGIYNNN